MRDVAEESDDRVSEMRAYKLISKAL
jgi:hypothetical protein